MTDSGTVLAEAAALVPDTAIELAETLQENQAPPTAGGEARLSAASTGAGDEGVGADDAQLPQPVAQVHGPGF